MDLYYDSYIFYNAKEIEMERERIIIIIDRINLYLVIISNFNH